MQEEPPRCPGIRALDPVLRKALAKERDDRYGSCAELIEAAAEALGVGAARAGRRPFVPPRLQRRTGRSSPPGCSCSPR